MISDLARLVQVESPSDDPAALRAAADVLAEIGGTHLGGAPERIGTGALVWRIGGGSTRVLLLGHYDTVWPVGSLATHPWRVTQEDGRRVARGPGCFDMKAGLVQALHAAALAERFGGNVALTVLVTPDEELGSPASRRLIEDEASRCSAALVFEASHDGALKTVRKGVGIYDLVAHGRAAHAGLEPERGHHAGLEIAAQALRIAALGDAALGTTVVPTRMTAGTTRNTVPARGELAVDVRATTLAELDRVDAALRRLTPHDPEVRLELVGGINRPPLSASSSAALGRIAAEVGDRLGLGEIGQVHVGGASDGNFTAGVGVPTLDGLGAVGGGAHSNSEHVLVDEMPDRTALAAGIILRLAEALP
jgi:glutamate carboxypeptidase